MLWYAIGFTVVVSILIITSKLNRTDALPAETEASDTDWDANAANELSRTLKERFARF
mgnify:CR=1 FL=1